MKNISWLRYTKPHPGTMRYYFMGKNFVVRLSTMKTTKISPPEKYLLYGIRTCMHACFLTRELLDMFVCAENHSTDEENKESLAHEGGFEIESTSESVKIQTPPSLSLSLSYFHECYSLRYPCISREQWQTHILILVRTNSNLSLCISCLFISLFLLPSTLIFSPPFFSLLDVFV